MDEMDKRTEQVIKHKVKNYSQALKQWAEKPNEKSLFTYPEFTPGSEHRR